MVVSYVRIQSERLNQTYFCTLDQSDRKFFTTLREMEDLVK